MKTLLNFLLYITQWLYLRMGGTLKVSRNEIILISPVGRHWVATEKAVDRRLLSTDLSRSDKMKLEMGLK